MTCICHIIHPSIVIPILIGSRLFKSVNIFEKRLFEILESENKIEVVKLLQPLIVILVSQPFDVIVELIEKIRQIIDLDESILQLDQNLFDVISVTTRITPLDTQLLQQLYSLGRRKGFLGFLPLLKDNYQLEKIVFFATGLEEAFESVVQ